MSLASLWMRRVRNTHHMIYYPEICNRDHPSLSDHCLMGIHKGSSINLQVDLKFFANTHKASIKQDMNDSIA